MNDASDETPPVNTDAAAELSAVGAGYGPLYAELQAWLERSPNAVDIEAAADEYEVGNNNFELLEKLAGLLPHTRHENFTIGEDNLQYLYRQLQANVIWWNNGAYYLIGKRISLEHEGCTDLLLMRTVDDAITADRGPLLSTVSVVNEDLGRRDQHIAEIERKELSGERIEELRDHGSVSLGGYMYGGSVVIAQNRKDRLQEPYRGVTLYSPAWGSHGNLDILHKKDWDSFQVSTEIAKMTHAFGVDQKLSEMLHYNGKATENRQLTYEELASQNQELRETLAAMMVAGGLLTTEEATARIDERFPGSGI